MTQIAERKEEARLLEQIAANIEALEALLRRHSDMWGYEDPIYRFYHQSFKVFCLQHATAEIVEALRQPRPPAYPDE